MLGLHPKLAPIPPPGSTPCVPTAIIVRPESTPCHDPISTTTGFGIPLESRSNPNVTYSPAPLLSYSQRVNLRLETDDFRLGLTDLMTVTVLVRHFQISQDLLQY